MKTLLKSSKRLVCTLLLVAQLLIPCNTPFAMTIGEERKIGQKLLLSVRNEFPLLDDPDISLYINNLGHQVLAVAGPQYFDYHFFVVLSDQFNAFAAPAGLVFFYTGLIETMKTEDELLSVLAHEIGHVVSRHIAQRIDKGGKVGAATLALGLASLALGIPALSQGILTGSLAAGQAINLHYSRTDEEQADRLSFDWMQAMHRNPVAMEGMLKTMRRITRYRSDKLPQYLLTHPNPEARLNYVESLMEIDPRQNQKDFYKKTDNFAFLRFKYRVLQKSIDPEKLRIHCANIITTDKEAEQVTMARYGLFLLERLDRNFPKAKQYLQLVQQAYPEQPILSVDMAATLREEGNLDEAQNLLKAFVHRNPTDMYARNELARVEQKKGNLAAAEKQYKVMEKSMPQYSQLYYELGRIYAGQKKNNLSSFYLGKYYLYTGKVKNAKQYLSKAAKDETLSEKVRNEAQTILDDLKKIEKES